MTLMNSSLTGEQFNTVVAMQFFEEIVIALLNCRNENVLTWYKSSLQYVVRCTASEYRMSKLCYFQPFSSEIEFYLPLKTNRF